MKKIFEKIRDEAEPYQDQRDDDGHARVTLKYALELLSLEDGNEDIVLPVIILHDVGYSQIPRERRMLIFDKDATPEQRKEVQYEHQRESVKLGRTILEKLEYPSELIPEILEIISQHDTRKGFISKNEGLVRDSDKLWRFSGESFGLRKHQDSFDRDKAFERLEKDLSDPDYIFSESAKLIARKELAARRKELSNG